MTATLYIEGGGDNRRLGAQFREGWTKFFERAGLAGRMPKVVRGGSRTQTFNRFETDVRGRSADVVPLLLVDSEHPVEANHPVWQHLRASDGWSKPVGAGDNDAFLMVQIMETWFLADRDALRKYFGSRFAENTLGQWAKLENVPKATVLDALHKATERCPNRYAKGRVSFELLAQVDPARVEASCPHGKALLKRLREL